MEIRFTLTREYVIQVEDDEPEALRDVDRVLTMAHVDGTDMADRLSELYVTDSDEAMVALSVWAQGRYGAQYTEVSDSWVCDDYTEPEDVDDDEEDDREEDEEETLTVG